MEFHQENNQMYGNRHKTVKLPLPPEIPLRIRKFALLIQNHFFTIFLIILLQK